ncbi:hypothetical protein SARC_11703 [Sphaeroforma arctica JP610]|uniref:Uncharacterized protein n=1 Tax=Sphaeroforma arctica JP610 TaxID=667725 RepID=A0A0L0FIB5_9EUKA|nr:hypothetical protein SARC_11703 [Sphaeroforma arctica JP610]KNC75778.1 hypothetical protein SARC_11703 [Sphaeroforma arctica JP610]|eukprot:XP_014149680.1 hypothetical protein SARC_11703 [Sphaeroforma arctica JP610]
MAAAEILQSNNQRVGNGACEDEDEMPMSSSGIDQSSDDDNESHDESDSSSNEDESEFYSDSDSDSESSSDSDSNSDGDSERESDEKLIDMGIDQETKLTQDIMWLIIVTIASIIPVLRSVRYKAKARMVYRYRPIFDEVAGHSLQMGQFDNDLKMTYAQFMILKEATTPVRQRDKFMGNLIIGRI